MPVLEACAVTSTSEDEWRSRATSGSWQDRADAARHWDALSISLSKRLARDADIRVRVALAERECLRPLPESVISDLYSSPTPAVRVALAGGIQPLTERQSLGFISDQSAEVRRAFARSKRPLSEGITRQIAAWTDPMLLADFIRSERELPHDTQLALAKSPNVAVRHALASAHGGALLLTDEAHLLLALDAEPLVRDAARETITVDVLTYASGHDLDTIREAASAFVINLAINGN